MLSRLGLSGIKRLQTDIMLSCFRHLVVYYLFVVVFVVQYQLIKCIIMKRVTKVEILHYVKEHFEKNPRALYYPSSNNDKDSVSCSYLTEEGHRCAHSICLTDIALKIMQQKCLINHGCDDVIEALGDIIHKPKFRGHSPEFWTDIQHFHDKGEFWEEKDSKGNSLTEFGQKRFQELLTKHHNGS